MIDEETIPTDAVGTRLRAAGPAVDVPPWVPRLLLPGALLALFAVVQAVFLRPPWPQDALTYFERAAAFPDVDHPDHWSLRIGLVLPLRALQSIFGYSEAAYYVVPLLAGAVLVVSMYWLGLKLFGPAVGFGAALVVVVSDVFLESSSAPLPDHVATALFTAAAAALVSLAERREEAAAWGARHHAMLVVVGLLLGWAYLAREFAAVLFPLVIVVFRVYGLPWRKLLWVAAAGAAVLLAEIVLNTVLYGSPLERFLVSGTHGGERDFITDTRLDAVLRLPRALRDAPGGSPLAAVCWLTPLALLVKQRSYRLIGTWFVAFWLPLTLGTGLVVPTFRFIDADHIRYWTLIIPALVVGGLALVQHAARAGVARWWPDRTSRSWVAGAAVVAVATLIAIDGSAGIASRSVYRGNGATQLSELRSWLADEGADVRVILTDYYGARLVPLAARDTFGTRIWSGEIGEHRLTTLLRARPAADTAIVLYRFSYDEHLRGFLGLTGNGTHPVPGWEVAVARPDESLVIYRALD